MIYPVTISGEYIWTFVTSPIRSSTRFGTVPPRFFKRDLSEIANRGLLSKLHATSQDFSRPPPGSLASVTASGSPRADSSATQNRARSSSLLVEVALPSTTAMRYRDSTAFCRVMADGIGGTVLQDRPATGARECSDGRARAQRVGHPGLDHGARAPGGVRFAARAFGKRGGIAYGAVWRRHPHAGHCRQLNEAAIAGAREAPGRDRGPRQPGARKRARRPLMGWRGSDRAGPRS